MAESEDIFLSVVNENRIIEDLLKETNDGLSKEVESMETEGEAKSRSTAKKLTEFPLSRIRTIMKMDPDVHIASQEAVYLVTKATELFLGSLVKETCKYTTKAKRKTVQRRDLDNVVENMDSLCFLEGALD